MVGLRSANALEVEAMMGAPPNPRKLSLAFQLGLLFAASALLVFLSHEFSREAGRVASIWPLNALLLAAIICMPRIDARFIFIAGAGANIAVDLAMGDGVMRAVQLTGANVAEIALCVWLLNLRAGAFDITRGAHLARFIVVAGIAAPACSSMIATVALSGAAPLASTFWMWYAADALGLLIFTPALLALATQLRTPALHRRGVELALSLIGVAGVSVLVFGQSQFPILFLVPPVLVLATFRVGIRGAGAGLLIVAVISIWFAIAGAGPTQLIEGGDIERVFILQAFLAFMSLTTLPVAAALAQGERARGELAAARAEAERNETQYRSLADYSTDIVVRLGRGGIISYASPACRILGIEPENAIGRSTLDFVAPDDRAFAAKIVQDLFTGAEPDRSIRREFRVPRPDGSIIWLEGNPSIIRDGAGEPVEVVTTYRDITARRQLEDDLSLARLAAEQAAEAVRASEERYRVMAETSLDMIARMDLNGRIKFVSSSSLAIMGYAPDDLVGTTTMQHTHRDDIARVVAFFDEIKAEGPGAEPRAYHFRARRKDGRIIWLEGIPRVLYDDAGQPREIQDSVRDITERKELELALAEARIAAESAARAKADFLANMSHEIRTPLNSILGFSRLLEQSGELDARDRRYAELVSNSGRSLLVIVNDVLDLSALDEGRLRIDSIPFAFPALVQEALDSFALGSEVKGLKFGVAYAGAPIERVCGDESRVRQVLTNLIGNAIKFTERGSVTVSIRAAAPRDGSQLLSVSVADTGIGIAPDALPTLFQRFTQADSSVSRQFGGSGLGLAITKQLVELMGGRIGADSTPGQGSTFWFELTLPIASHETTNPAAALEHRPTRRILIVDDVQENRELMCALLAAHSVTHAIDGEDAINKARREHFDLVLMDVQMPGIDGLEATRRLRAEPNLAQLPIVAVSAHALPDQVTSFLEAGMNDYLPKPIEPEVLAAMVNKWAGGEIDAAAPTQAVLSSLQARFIARCQDDLQTLSAPEVEPSVARAIIHRLAGAAATFGFPEVGQAALRADQRFSAGAMPTQHDIAAIVAALQTICASASAA